MKVFPKSTEQIQDIVAALLVEGTGVSLVYNDSAGTLTISSDVDLSDYATTSYVDDELSAALGIAAAFASDASNLTTGTVPDARLSSNVPRLNAASNAFTGLIDTSRTDATTNRYQWRSDDGGQWAIATGGVAGASGFRIVRPGVADMAMFIANSGMTIYGSVTSSTGVINVGTGVQIVRNATGPTFETRAAGGARICNADGSALAALACGAITCTSVTASGTITFGPTAVVPGSGTSFSSTGYASLSFNAGGATFGSNFIFNAGTSTGVMAAYGQSEILSLFGIARAGYTVVGAVAGTGLLVGSVGPTRYHASSHVFRDATNSADGSIACGNLTASGFIDGALRPFTVAGLPLASANTRKEYWVTDSTLAMTSANYGSTVSGGGANGARVISNGTNWIIA